MSRIAGDLIADARLLIKDIGGKITNEQCYQLLNYRYQTWWDKFGRRVVDESSLQTGLSFLVANTVKTTTSKDIEKFLAILLSSGAELEMDTMDNVVRLQTIASTQGVPRLVAVVQVIDAVSPGSWQVRLWPIPDTTYALTSRIKKRLGPIVDTGDAIDLPDVDTHRLSRLLAYDMGVILSRPAERLQQLIAEFPDELKAAFGLSQAILAPRAYPQKQEA